MRNFVAVVLAETEDVWNATFAKSGKTYQEPKLVLFSGAVESACGMAGSAVGPFYCPADHKVYLDLDFFEEQSRMIHDLDRLGDGRRGVFYTKKKPLNLAAFEKKGLGI